MIDNNNKTKIGTNTKDFDEFAIDVLHNIEDHVYLIITQINKIQSELRYYD